MKKSNFLKVMLLALPFLILFSCKKEDVILNDAPINVSSKQGEDLKETLLEKEMHLTELIDCFDNNSEEINAPKFSEIFGEIATRKVLYRSKEGNDTYVFPIKKDNEIEQLFLINDEEVYVLKKTDKLALEDVEGLGVSAFITRVYDIDGYLTSKNELTDIKNVINQDFTYELVDNILVLEEKATITGELAESGTSSFTLLCEEFINSMESSYLDFFGLSNDYADLVNQSLVNCHAGFTYCICPNPACVLEDLIPEVSDTEVQNQLLVVYASFCAQLNVDQQAYLNDNLDLLSDIIEFLSDNGCGSETTMAIQLLTQLKIYGVFYEPNVEDYLLITQGFEPIASDPYHEDLLAMEVGALKLVHQSCDCPDDWSDARIYLQATYNVFIDEVHLGLDVLGLVPGFGEVADLVNGTIYTLEGDGINAALSYSAAIPFLGWTASSAKWGIRAVTTATGTTSVLKFIEDGVTGVISFGDRGQLKTVIKPPTNHQAHHIIPWEHVNHPLIQQSAKTPSIEIPFHMNDHVNGIPMHLSRHNGSHNDYNAYVFEELNDIFYNTYGGIITSSQAKAEVVNLTNTIRAAINNNPTTHINTLF